MNYNGTSVDNLPQGNFSPPVLILFLFQEYTSAATGRLSQALECFLSLLFLGASRKRDDQSALISVFFKICCYVQTPEAFNAELQVLLGTRQDSWVLEHDFQPDLDTNLVLTEKSFTRDNCKISSVPLH